MVMVLVSTVAEAAIAPAMISACTNKLCGPAQPAERTLPALHRRVFEGNVIQHEGGRGVLGIQARIRLRSIKQWPNLPFVPIAPCDARCRGILPQTDGDVSQQTRRIFV